MSQYLFQKTEHLKHKHTEATGRRIMILKQIKDKHKRDILPTVRPVC